MAAGVRVRSLALIAIALMGAYPAGDRARAATPTVQVVPTGGSSSPASVVGIHQAAGTAFVETTDPTTLRAIDPATGTTGHILAIPDAEQAPEIVVDQVTQRAFVLHNVPTATTTTLTTDDLAQGRVVRTLTRRCCAQLFTVDGRSGRAFIVDPVTGTTGALHVVDLATGATVRTTTIPEGPLALAVDAPDERVFLFDAGGAPTGRAGSDLRTFDGSTGALIGTLAVPAAVPSLVVDPAAHRAFIADRAGAAVTVIDTATGRRIRTIRVLQTAARTAVASLAVDDRTGRLFISSVAGISMYNVATGRLVGDVTGLHGAAGSLAVDELRDRVFAGLIDATVAADGQTERVATYVGVIDPTTGIGHQDLVGRGTTRRADQASAVQRMTNPLVSVDEADARLVLTGFFDTRGRGGRGNSVSIVAERDL